MKFDDWWATLTTREQARMVKDDCSEAWHEGFKDGYEKGVSAFHESVKIEREACARVCESEADKMEDGAQRAIENGEHDEVSAIRSTAWKLSVAANRIRARSNAEIKGLAGSFASPA